MGKPPFSIGRIAPTPKLVDQFFDNSTGEGDYGEVNAEAPGIRAARGNSSNRQRLPTSTALRVTVEDQSPYLHAESSGPGDKSIKELLVEQLRDILHAETQLTKALPKMVKAAHSEQLQRLFEVHLGEPKPRRNA